MSEVNTGESGGNRDDAWLRPQSYETVIDDDASESSVFVFAIPKRSMQRFDPTQTFPQWLPDEYLFPHFFGDLIEPYLLSEPDVIQVDVGRLKSDDVQRHLWSLLDRPDRPDESASSSERRRFAEYLFQAPVVPFERSPLSAVSLHDIVRASGTAVGAYVGYAVVKDGAFMFLAVPAGMLICGSASGIAHGLEEGLRERVRSWLKPKATNRSGPAKKRAARSSGAGTAGKAPPQPGPTSGDSGTEDS